ncbi:MAG TPA: NTP transferase domain-containing protein [Pirellulales bacterium]|nr:NTP transferase domain-containing protein [Pirellulales bacterium]
MSRTMAVIQPRGTTAGCKPHHARKLGGQSLMERVVRRVTDCERLERVVVVVSDRPEDEEIFNLVPRDVAVFVSQRHDALARVSDAVDHFRPDAVVCVPADQPCIDPDFVDRLIITAGEHPTCDYISYSSRDGQPAILSPLGVFAEWCRSSALRRADREATSASDREEVTRYLYSHPEIFRLRLIPVPTELDRDDLRLTVEHEEDWDHLHTIYDALGHEGFEWRQITDLLHRNPQVLARMAHLNREFATR